MSYTIFYSWLSDRSQEYNRDFIENCLKEAISRLKHVYGDGSTDFYLDRDFKDVPGYPSVPQSVLKKIDAAADLFVADLTVIGELSQADGTRKPMQNNNVISELGYAIGKIGENRIVPVMNSAFGDPKEPGVIPFDLAQRAFPITYELSEKNAGEIGSIAERFIAELFDRIRLIFEIEHERQKKHFAPFDTWRSWEGMTTRNFAFERNDYIMMQMGSIQGHLKEVQALTRVLGLSGLGKTNLVLECFRAGCMDMTEEMSNRVLYANMNECEETAVLEKLKEFFSEGTPKIIILDNCQLSAHEKAKRFVQHTDSKLT